MTHLTLFAQKVIKRENCEESARNDQCLSILPDVSTDGTQLRNGLAVIFATFAAVAIIVIIIAAINFANSEGNPENISKAKQTIIYALIGLVISLSAEAVVLTLLGRI